jgi:hypothetical protein
VNKERDNSGQPFWADFRPIDQKVTPAGLPGLNPTPGPAAYPKGRFPRGSGLGRTPLSDCRAKSGGYIRHFGENSPGFPASKTTVRSRASAAVHAILRLA